MLLAQAGDIPDTNRLVERGGGDEILGGVELSTHNIVVVAGHGTD